MTNTTPFEQGKIAGQWTDKQLAECGFSSAQECLEHEEKLYQENLKEVAEIRVTNPVYAAKQAEYIAGEIAGARESLLNR